jgi:hypothetical protein
MISCYFVLPAMLSAATVEVNSNTPILLDGNWIKPIDGVFTIEKSDGRVLINNIVYYDVEMYKEISKPLEIDKNHDPVTWLFQEATIRAQKIIDTGSTVDEARNGMKQLIDEYVGSTVDRYELDKEGNFRIYIRDACIPVLLVAPRNPERLIAINENYDDLVEAQYRTILSQLQAGMFIVRFSIENSMRTFSKGEKDKVIEGIVDFKENQPPISNSDSDKPTIIAGHKFTPSELDVIINPRKMVRIKQ